MSWQIQLKTSNTTIQVLILKLKHHENTFFNPCLLLSTTGCTEAEGNNNNTTAQTIDFTEIGKGSLYGNGAEGIQQSNLVIKTKTEWESLMQKMNSVNNVTDNFTETDIDFNTHMVIAVFDTGRLPVSNTTIEKINASKHNINIIYTIVVSDATGGILGQGFHIIKTPISNHELIFNLKTQ